jgi:hypothetical protein
MQFRPEHIYTFIAFVSSILGMWSILSAKLTRQENRSTVLEKDIENLREFKESANRRLDSHEEQNKALLVLAEQVKTLSEDVKELKILITKGE